VRRLALVAVAALACTSQTTNTEPGPLDGYFYPTGIGVLDRRLVVASSNADLSYASDTGGSVIAADPCRPDPASPEVPSTCEVDPAVVTGALNIQSFSGEIGVADPAACAELTAAGKGASLLVPIRGVNLVYRLAADASGALSCDGCDIGVGSSSHGDPFSVGIACGPGVARAYVGYLRTTYGQTWLTQIDLLKGPGETGYVRHWVLPDVSGQVRGFAYDASLKRLYFTRTVSGSTTALLWLNLANGCLVDVANVQDGGCPFGLSRAGDVPAGLELRGIALANAAAVGGVRRAYVTARIYDAAQAAAAGGRVGDFDGLLLVVDLWEDVAGLLRFTIVDQIPIGYGAEEVRVLPERAGKRDVVVALAQDDGVLWVYDDETGERVAVSRSPVTGAPLVGRTPGGLAVDPLRLAGNVVRVYVGSFQESFVTPIDVPLDAPETAAIVTSGGEIRRIGPQLAQKAGTP